MTTTTTDRDRFLADAKATASRAGLTIPERLEYVAARAALYDAEHPAPVHASGCGICGTW